MNSVDRVFKEMISYYAGDVHQINHFVKVYGFAKEIGAMEGLNDTTQEILEIAALTHDIGIKNSKAKYGSSGGNYQQIEGPPEAIRMLESLAINEVVIERVCWLITHHHTYNNIDGVDYQILVEADFLVNIFEGRMPLDSIKSIKEKIFKTKSGLYILNALFLSSMEQTET